MMMMKGYFAQQQRETTTDWKTKLRKAKATTTDWASSLFGKAPVEKHGAACEDIGNVWDAFVDAFVGTLHAQGGAGCASRAGPSSVKKDYDDGRKRGQDVMTMATTTPREGESES